MTAGDVIATRVPKVTRRSVRARRWLSLPPGVIVSLIFLMLVLVAVAAPSMLTSTQPLQADPLNGLAAPSPAHPFGTDASGRDVLGRLVYGARLSLTLAVLAILLALFIAVVLGLLGGLGGRFLDSVVGGVLDVWFAFPALLLAIVIVATLGQHPSTMVIAMGIGAAPGYARLIRGQVLSVRNRPYVEAAAILGHPYARVVVRTILPNALRPLVGVATIGVADMIVVATSLGFLGLGAQPPSPEWGAMLAAGRDYFSTAWWVELFPGAVIITLALATATVGRHLLLSLEGRTAS